MYTLSAIPPEYWSGKRVLIRVDFNVPLTPEGEVADDTRIRKSLPTIQHLLKHKAGVCLCTHLGRPGGKPNLNLSLRPIAERLSQILGQEVRFLTNPLGQKEIREGEVVLLQNVRFFPEEKSNSTFFSALLARGCDFYINDAFGTAHREHASTVGAASLLPHAAGYLIEKEVQVLTELMEQPRTPLSIVVGGAKMETKIGVLEQFVQRANSIILGGGIANTFLAAQGWDIKDSLYEPREVLRAKTIIEKAKKHDCQLITPVDAIVNTSLSEEGWRESTLENLEAGEKILDIGPESLKKALEILESSQTVLWNGPMGLVEYAAYRGGTESIARALSKSTATTILGGGDTLEILKESDMPEESYSHLSTGGGAMLRFLEGSKLPALEVLSHNPPEREAAEKILQTTPYEDS